jgi:hypothetical protein
MGEAVPRLEVDLTRVDADLQIVVVKLSAENVPHPGEDGGSRGSRFF